MGVKVENLEKVYAVSLELGRMKRLVAALNDPAGLSSPTVGQDLLWFLTGRFADKNKNLVSQFIKEVLASTESVKTQIQDELAQVGVDIVDQTGVKA